MSNPYQPPQPPLQPAMSYGGEIDREKLRRVARYQQWVIYAVLANIVMYVIAMAMQQSGLLVNLAVIAAALAVAVFGMVAIFLLASEVYNAGIGVLCAVLMIVPCISLITLLIVNAKATGFLQQRGVKVGFMGVNPNQI